MEAWSIFTDTFGVFLNGLAFVQNVIVLVLYKRRSNFVLSPRPLFGVSILVAEAILCLFGVLQYILDVIMYDESNWTEFLNEITVYLIYSSDMTSQWLQFAFVLDLVVKVRFPLKYAAWFTSKRKQAACATIWVISIIAAITLSINAVTLTYTYASDDLSDSNDDILTVQDLVIFIVTLIPGPLSLALFLYIQILVCNARARTRRLVGQANGLSVASGVMESRKNLILAALMSAMKSLGIAALSVLKCVENFYGIESEYLYTVLDIVFSMIANAALLVTPWILKEQNFLNTSLP